jgi:predicted RNA-binding Zn-ribbon protein involved in translation (DUF1610 family)
MKVTAMAEVPPSSVFHCSGGRFNVARFEDPNRFKHSKKLIWLRDTKVEWWFTIRQQLDTSGAPYVSMWCAPLWPFVLLTGVPGVWMLVKTRKHTNPNACPACGYDRTGLPQSPTGPAPCPECGKGKDDDAVKG